MTYISCIDTFKSECDNIISSLDSSEVIQANKFLSLALKVGKRYPLISLPDFFEDFMNGMYSHQMKSKYHLYGQEFSNLTRGTLKLTGVRSKKSNFNNKEANMSNPQWKKQYDLVMSQEESFKTPLDSLLNCNILKRLFCHALLSLEYISRYELKDKVLVMYDQLTDSTRTNYTDEMAKVPTTYDQLNCSNMFWNVYKKESFEQYMQEDLEYKLRSIVDNMKRDFLITSMDGDVSLPVQYSNVMERIYNMIDSNADGILHSSLRTKILNEFPLFKIISNMKMIDGILQEMESRYDVVRKQAFWKYSPDSDQLFTSKNYNTKMEQIRKQIVSKGRTKFFGRIISPDQFIHELKDLELGDLDDLDDQVTRIAGLVLSDSVMPQSPRENAKEFDFIVDITSYNFRPEQEELMKKLDFRVQSNIFHCKVMINKTITMNTIKKLKNAIPNGEQAVIFTCKPIPNTVIQQLDSDKTVQVIDEEGIRNWCSITPTIPCRLHSIAKVMYGDYVGKIVYIKSLNYESGLATVETIPDRVETTFEIGKLQEIDLHVSNEVDVDSASEEYANLCTLLDESYNGSLESVNDVRIIDVYHSWQELERNVRPDLYDIPCPKRPSFAYADKHLKYVKFDTDIYTTIDMRENSSEPFSCMCSHNINEEYHHTLCKHLVSSIMHLCIGGLDWSTTNRNIQYLKKLLINFQKNNARRVIRAILDTIELRHRYLLKEYLQKYADDDVINTTQPMMQKNDDKELSCENIEELKTRIMSTLKDEPKMLELFGVLDQKITTYDKNTLHKLSMNVED